MSYVYKDMSVKEMTRYLGRFDIDINRVMDEGIDETGYDEIQLHPDGRPKASQEGRIARVRRQWPEGFDYDHFRALLTGQTPKGNGEVQEDGTVVVTSDEDPKPGVDGEQPESDEKKTEPDTQPRKRTRKPKAEDPA